MNGVYTYVGSGTQFPASANLGDAFYRTDLGRDYFNSIVGWITQTRNKTRLRAREDFGVFFDGYHDDTKAMQSALDASIGTTLEIPDGYCLLSAPLEDPGGITLVGQGGYELNGSALTYGLDGCNMPMIAPYLKGSIFVQTTAGTDIIQNLANGIPSNYRDFGMLFAPSIAYQNTGHGINCLPPAGANHFDNGPMNFEWSNIKVYGHDGNHYGFVINNPLYGQLRNLRSYGGGAFQFIQSTNTTNMGNIVAEHLYGVVFLAGSAHGIYFKNTATVTQYLNFLTFIRPQIWVYAPSHPPAGTSPPTNAQFNVNSDANAGGCLFISPDWESNVGGLPKVVLPTANDGHGTQYVGGGATNARNANPTGAVNVGTVYQNLSGTNLLCLMTFTLNPPVDAAAAVTVQISSNSGMSSPITVANLSVPAGGPVGGIQQVSFMIPSLYYFEITALTNAVRSSTAYQAVMS